MDEALEGTARFMQRVTERKPPPDASRLALHEEKTRRQMRLSLILEKIGMISGIQAASLDNGLEREDQIIRWVLDKARVEDAPGSYEMLKDWRLKEFRYS
jgi:hypothetical protein